MLDRNILRAGFFRAALYCECSPSQGLAKIKASKCKYKCIQIRLKSTRMKYNQLNGLPIHTLYWSSWHLATTSLHTDLLKQPGGGGVALTHHLHGLVPLGGGGGLVPAHLLQVALVSLPTFSVY